MLRVLHFLFLFVLISCASTKNKPIVDYYPAPKIRRITNQGVKRVVFLYKNKEVSENSFSNIIKKKKRLSLQVIKDSLQIERMGYDPHKVRGVVSALKIKNSK